MTASEWPPIRLRFCTTINPSKSEIGYFSDTVEVSFLPMEAIGEDGTVSFDDTRTISAVQQGYTYFRDGDVLIAKITPCFENGKGACVSGLLNGVGFGTTELIVVRAVPNRLNNAFLHWVFTSPDFRNAATATMFGAGGQKRVPDDFVRDYRLALPPLPMQQAIAAFLDRETAKIDGLVAEQERLLILLEEKRQAVIANAVTKGLDPTVPMKDSGMDGLGVVPAHWKQTRLKYVAGDVTVGVVVKPSQYYAPTGTIALRSLNIKPMGISVDDVVYFDPALEQQLGKSRLTQGDVVVVRTGKPGTAAVVGPEYDGINCIDLIIIRRSIALVPRFLALMLNSEACRVQYARGAEGALQQHFNIETAKNLVLAIPEIHEQQSIITRLEHELTRLEGLVDEASRNLALMRDRRASLISAAVTGKIDVRASVALAAKPALAAE